MKISLGLVACLVACGGSKPAPKAPPPPPPAAKVVEAPPPPAPPPVPKMTHAKAALAAMKGVKFGGATVSFAQQEGEDTAVTSDDFAGLKAGKYHLVLHDGETCAKPGEPWKGGAAIELAVTITKDEHSLAETKVKLDLGGVAPATGHTLLLHEDKKGKPGKALACGTIEAVGAATE